jgi:hypothetical protein
MAITIQLPLGVEEELRRQYPMPEIGKFGSNTILCGEAGLRFYPGTEGLGK